ncbi:hypothetical protein [Pedobacter miscanthi]|jgi:hypothetical protein|nr:hypothetical protein [Pedobacter miscanthi]
MCLGEDSAAAVQQVQQPVALPALQELHLAHVATNMLAATVVQDALHAVV